MATLVVELTMTTTPPPSKPLVICVDDDEAMLATVQRCLKREPIEIRGTLSASEALGWIASEDVAVLVSDYDMPEMTGAQLAGHARRVRPETVRILLTGKRTLETAIDGINQGEIFRFLNKPFDNEVLRAVVAEGVARNKELLAMSGDRERRERREALRAALEAEYPGISQISRRGEQPHELPVDPWTEAEELGLVGLTPSLEKPT
jgi:DNA-binding NtrC family response regulator